MSLEPDRRELRNRKFTQGNREPQEVFESCRAFLEKQGEPCAGIPVGSL